MDKNAVITAIVLIILGISLFLLALYGHGFDFSRLTTEYGKLRTQYVTDSFHSIHIDTDTSKVTLLPSTDGQCRVEIRETDKRLHKITTDNGILSITVTDQREWYHYIGFIQKSLDLKVYLPETVYRSLTIETGTGAITIPKEFTFDTISIAATTADISCEASADSVSLTTNTGDMVLQNINCTGALTADRTTGRLIMKSVRCGSLTIRGNTGDTKLTDVIVEGTVSIKTTTGDIIFDHCDGGDITVQTDTGDVTGTLLTGKLFTGSTSTGHVRLPNPTGSQKCQITTSTGDIEILVP